MAKLPLSGGAYQAASVICSAQRSLNLFAEPMPEIQGEPAKFAYYPTPGLRLLGNLPAGPIRGIRQCTTGGVYAVAGSGVYRVNTSDWTGTLLGSITEMRPYPVSMQDNGLDLVIVDGTASGWKVTLASDALAEIPLIPDATRGRLVSGAFDAPAQAALLTALQAISDGSFSITVNGNLMALPPQDFTGIASLSEAASMINALAVEGAAGTFSWSGTAGTFTLTSARTGSTSTVTFASSPPTGTDISATLKLTDASGAADPVNGVDASAFYGADRVDLLDTYFVLNKPATPQFYSSDSLATTFDPLWFANAESYSDLLVTLAVAKREIWLLGERTTEVWFNSGAADFPFQRVQSVFIDQGCRAKYSVATHDDRVYWLARDRSGQGIVLQGANYESKRISTYAIEHELTAYERTDDAVGFVYSLSGHSFYVLTFPTADKTWVYDITTGQWHEWLWIDNNGVEHRHRAMCAYAINDMVVLGDRQNGNLYELRRDVHTDNGQPIKRQRSFPHIINDSNRVYHRQFVADIESGNPPDGPQGPTTRTLLSCSFTAPDMTLLEDYASGADTNAHWTEMSGSARVEDDEMLGETGDGALYHSPVLPSSDYTLQFRAIPTNYTAVPVGSVFAIARANGAGTGYRAQVSGNGTQYSLSLGVEGGSSTTLAMGTIADGAYVLTMTLAGAHIELFAQRTAGGQYLNASAIWDAARVPAVTLDDETYSASGTVNIGGAW